MDSVKVLFLLKRKKFDFDVQGHGEAKEALELTSELNINKMDTTWI